MGRRWGLGVGSWGWELGLGWGVEACATLHGMRRVPAPAFGLPSAAALRDGVSASAWTYGGSGSRWVGAKATGEAEVEGEGEGEDDPPTQAPRPGS